MRKPILSGDVGAAVAFVAPATDGTRALPRAGEAASRASASASLANSATAPRTEWPTGCGCETKGGGFLAVCDSVLFCYFALIDVFVLLFTDLLVQYI